MNTLTYTKTFEVDDDGSVRWATYHWGNLAISEYSVWSWRGNDYRVETADNPFDFLPDLSGAVMRLDRCEICDHIPVFDARLAVEWWNTQQPGLLLGLEVKEDGSLWAKVWTGNLGVWGDYRHTFTFTPQLALENWHDLTLHFNGTMHIHETITMVGPVGMVSELEPWQDQEPSDLDLDVWGGGRCDDGNHSHTHRGSPLGAPVATNSIYHRQARRALR